ncbi:MAG: DUF2938 domain-containing protein [Burkholderiales bacterium]|nr:DUF2938 domain-containing protein [Burkholderiales bacterium]
MDHVYSALFIGVGATLATDLWAIARARLLRVPMPDWGLVGRWFAHMARGRFRHERIAAAEPVRGERMIGWIAHYLIGIAFAGALLATCGLAWAHQPTLAPALAVGLVSVAAPFLLMQPALGAGVAARRTPRPNVARMHSLITHTVFGLGLYAAAIVLATISGR